MLLYKKLLLVTFSTTLVIHHSVSKLLAYTFIDIDFIIYILLIVIIKVQELEYL